MVRRFVLLRLMAVYRHPESLTYVLRQVRVNYYPIGEEPELPFHICALLYRAGSYGQVLEFSRRPERLHGPHASTSYEMGTCHYTLGYQEPAQAFVDEARRLDPECEEAPWIAAAE